MNLGLIGVGGAGCRIVESIYRFEKATGLALSEGHILCFDTDRDALAALDGIPSDRRIPIGDTVDRVAQGPVDGDADLAAEVARIDDYEIQRSFDIIPIERLDGLLLVGGLAGGTGGGAGAQILEMCQAMFDPPVYSVAVLPQEAEGDQAAHTASRTLPSYVRLADAVLGFDNETWIDSTEEPSFAGANDVLAERIVRFLAVGDFGGVLAERRVDRTDIMRTLEPGGVTSIGMASTAVYPGWRRLLRWAPWVQPTITDGTNAAFQVKNLVRRAIEDALTIPCNVTSAERAIVILSGPPSVLSRQGFESARYWIEQEVETVEVIAGDEPHPRNRMLRAVVVLSNVTDIPRVKSMQSQALLASQNPPDDQ